MADAARAPAPVKVQYEASPTLTRFHHSPKFIRVVRGPAGSGKSVGCVMESVRLGSLQPPGPDGIRRSRTLVLRNTYPELLNTTIRTFKSWFPPSVFHMVMSPVITATLNLGDLVIEYAFLSYDRDDRDRQIKSFECSNAYLNEVVELPKSALDAVTRAVGRYPREIDGGVTRPCVFADTNSCDIDHWLYHLAEVEKPTDFELFAQPPAVIKLGRKMQGRMVYAPNPRAENIRFLPGGHEYYRRMMVGKKDSWIRVFVCNEYGDVLQGRPCHPSFSDRHVRQTIPVLRGIGLRLGWDYGRTPSCIIAQKSADGQLRILREIVTDAKGDGMALRTFVRKYVRPVLETEFPGMSVIQSTGDPSGSSGGQAEENSCEDVLAEEGIPTMSAPTNDIEPRLEAVDQLLDQNTSANEPMLLVSASGAPICLAALRGKYQMERRRVEGQEGLFKETPIKNSYSHPMDATQYLALGARAESMTTSIHTAVARPVEPARRYGA